MSTKSEKNKKKEQNIKEPTELNKLIIQEVQYGMIAYIS